MNKKPLCWAGFWDLSDDTGIWRCVLDEGHEGAHEYKQPSDFNEDTGTLTIRCRNGDVVEIKAGPER